VRERDEGHEAMSGLELLGWAWPEIGAAFALAASAIVVLYLVRLRRRVVTVPWVALFRDALPDQRSTRLFTRLKNLLSLLLALLVAALIALALGQPRLAEDRDEAQTLVLVLDTSASMQALLEDAEGVREGASERRFDRARTAALARVASLHPTDRVLVLAASSHARVVHPMTTEQALVAEALRELEPSDSPGDATEALAWATRICARERGPCTVEILSDGGLSGANEAIEAARARGLTVQSRLVTDTRADDVAITALSARRFPADPSRAELLIELASSSRATEEVVLSILADDALAHRETITLAPGQTLSRTLDELTGADALFEARLSRADGSRLDALEVDDVAWARLAPRRRRRAALVSAASNVYLEAALLLDPYLDVATITPEAYESGGVAADRELVIFDGYTPLAPPRLPSLLLAPGTPARDWLRVGEPIERPRFDTQDRDHPLLAFVALRDVNVASARPLVLEPGDERVAGETRGALLSTGTREGVRFVALGLDVRASDLPLRIAWPILVLDALAHLLPDDLTLAPAAETGRAFRLSLPGEATLSPRGESAGAPIELAPREGVVQLELERAGVYVVRAHDDSSDEAPRLVVANLFSRDESRLEAPALEGATLVDPDADVSAISARETEEREAPRWPLHVLLVMGALALLALEWLTFHRRWTT
jgi:hypothetical protein